MNEYITIFTNNLRKKLEKKVKGTVYINVTKRDSLYVRIVTFGDLTYMYRLNDISNRIASGLTTEYLTYEIVGEFEKMVLRNYLR